MSPDPNDVNYAAGTQTEWALTSESIAVAQVGNEATMTMDDIWTAGVDQDKVADTARKMLLARGPYVTTPPLTVSGMRFEARDGMPARLIFRAYGPVTWVGNDLPTFKNADGSSVQAPLEGRISFSFSPQEQMFVSKVDGSQTPDSATKAWVWLVKAYTKAYGHPPLTAQDIKTYLESYPVKLTISISGKDDPRNGVFYIGPAA